MESKQVLIDEVEAARTLSCSVAKLRSDRFYGKGLRYIKLGRSIRYRAQDVADYIDAHVVEPRSKAA